MSPSNVISAFALPIQILKNIHPPQQEYFLGIYKIKFEGRYKTNVFSLKENLLDSSDLKNLANIIDQKAKEFMTDVLSLKNDIYRVNSWAARSQGNHHSHMHPGAFISVVYYLKANSGDLIITDLRDPLQKGFNFEYAIKNYNVFNSKEYTIEARTGDMVIFPGWLKHETSKVSSDRIIIGANYFLKGPVGFKKNYSLVNL